MCRVKRRRSCTKLTTSACYSRLTTTAPYATTPTMTCHTAARPAAPFCTAKLNNTIQVKGKGRVGILSVRKHNTQWVDRSRLAASMSNFCIIASTTLSYLAWINLVGLVEVVAHAKLGHLTNQRLPVLIAVSVVRPCLFASATRF